MYHTSASSLAFLAMAVVLLGLNKSSSRRLKWPHAIRKVPAVPVSSPTFVGIYYWYIFSKEVTAL